MFYVPQRTLFPKQKHSLKFINKIEEQQKRKKEAQNSEEHKKKSKSKRKRFKTLCENADKTQQIGIHNQRKKSLVVVLPSIFQRNFMLKGKIAVNQKDKSKSINKIDHIKQTIKTGRIMHRQPKRKKKQCDKTLADYYQLEPWSNRCWEED